MRVLLVEDAERLARYIRNALTEAGYAVDLALNGEDGLWLALTVDYDAIILDLMLPKLDGITVLQRLRHKGRKTHILILTAKATVPDRIRGFEEGADDYLVKPFALEELVARVQTLVRRSYRLKNPIIEIGLLKIDTARRKATYKDQALDLTSHEYVLLEYMAMRRGDVVSRSDIENHIYDEQAEPMSNVIDSSVYRLRKKIDKPGEPMLIRTRRGMGYVLEEPRP